MGNGCGATYSKQAPGMMLDARCKVSNDVYNLEICPMNLAVIEADRRTVLVCLVGIITVEMREFWASALS